MSYRVDIPLHVGKAIASWQLPAAVFVEIYLRLRADLSEDPASRLVRTTEPYDGMSYYFSMVDPDNRLCQHSFAFQVVYAQDEERLVVARGGYARTVGI